MPLNIGGKMNVDGIHASGNAKIEESASSGGQIKIWYNFVFSFYMSSSFKVIQQKKTTSK